MKRLVLALALVLLGIQPALAQETFSFQGRLTGPDGAPVADGSYGIQFQLFDAPTGGSPRWAEGHSLTTSGGVFSVVLGTKATLNLDLFDEMPYLLLIVDNEEMEPRVPLTAVPYAMKSYRLDEAALVAGANVSITQRADGTLQIGSTGGGGGTGGLTSVASDATLTGNGTSAAPLGLADGSVTGAKLSNNALLAGANVDIVRRGNGSWEISSTGSGGLMQVASDATLTGEGTAGSPLMVSAPLVLTSNETGGAVRGENTNGNYGQLGNELAGVYGISNNIYGVYGSSVSGRGVFGSSSSGNGVRGTSNSGIGVSGGSSSGFGVSGGSGSSSGVYGQSSSGHGVWGVSSSGFGVSGTSTSSYGVYGENDSGNWGALGTSTFAGAFGGNVHVSGDMDVTGMLSKGGGTFKIDHPLDPANKYLSHSFVESPDMMNVYNGNVTTDANGVAIVTLPDYFEALNRDFRYQLTVIGQFAQAIIAEEIHGNQFVIRTDLPNVEVSWLVTGIRQDAWAEEHRIVVEENKPAEERGFYLYPKLFGQPQERRVEWARDLEGMRELQERPAQNKEERRHMDEAHQRRQAEHERLQTERPPHPTPRDNQP